MSYDIKLTKGSLEIKDGKVQTVSNKEKLIQDILKMLFTQTGENKIHPWYGTPLLSRVVGNATDPEILQTELITGIEYGLKNLKTLQELQSNDNQYVSPQELISKIVSVKVNLDEVDPRRIVVNVLVTAKSNDLISESFTIRV